jgi:cytochrome b6
LVTVLLARAYRRPRELTWISGVLLLFLVAASGFSGYLLPWSELSYYATLVGTQIPGTLPGVGDLFVHVLRGGDQLTGETLTRFFAAHVLFVPVAMGLLLAIHVFFTRIRGLSVPIGVGKEGVRDRRPFFSEFLPIEACLWLLLFGVIVTLAVFLPAEIGVKADPLSSAPKGIQPEWYFLALFQLLKLVPKTVGVGLFALGALFLLVLPFLDRSTMRGKKSPLWTVGFVALLIAVVGLHLLAWFSPGPQRPHQALSAETFSLSRSLTSLALVWSVIGFLVFYLRQLAKENTRVRRLYKEKPAEDK